MRRESGVLSCTVHVQVHNCVCVCVCVCVLNSIHYLSVPLLLFKRPMLVISFCFSSLMTVCTSRTVDSFRGEPGRAAGEVGLPARSLPNGILPGPNLPLAAAC